MKRTHLLRFHCATPCHQGDVLPDGSDAGEARQYLARHDAEQELAAAEAAVAQGLPVRRAGVWPLGWSTAIMNADPCGMGGERSQAGK